MFNKTLNHKKTNKKNKKTIPKRNAPKKPPITKANTQDKTHSQTQTVNVYTHGHYQRSTNTWRQIVTPTRTTFDTYQPRLPMFTWMVH